MRCADLNQYKQRYPCPMIPAAETERLLLRPLALDDADQIQTIFPHWEIVRYLLNRVPWPYPPNGARHFIEQIALPDIARGESWIWTLRLKSAPAEIIGTLELRLGEDSRGFWLGLPWQGRGLMLEACAWANDFWFDTLGFPVLRVSKAIANQSSVRISERQGMRLIGTSERDYVSGRLPSETYELTAEEWHARKHSYRRSPDRL
jgi:[ribosomal protein S5]-alanine N-acetyltransferase